MNNKPKIVLFGTPEFAALSFRALIESDLYSIPLVVTQPDQAVGRGLQVNFCPVKKLALANNIPVLQPTSLKGISQSSKEFLETLKRLAPIDLFVVIAYGKIIPKSLLDIPTICSLNIHGSLLPRWRGAAPIHRAIAAGDTETGIGIMKLEEGLDTGPVFAESVIKILPDDNFLTLHDRMARSGVELLTSTIPKILSGSLQPIAQPSEGITYAEKWSKVDLEICWSDPSSTTINRVRASSPFPGARAMLNGALVKVFEVTEYLPLASGLPCGTILEIKEDGAVVQLSGYERILVKEIQISGKKRLPVAEVARGRGIKVGDCFTQVTG